MNLSKHLTLEQAKKSATASRLGIDNTPTLEHLKALRTLGEKVYDAVKEKFPDCYPTSVYRSKALNTAIKGAAASQHCKGEAIDIDRPSNKQNTELFKWIKDNLEFDQMIAEFCTKEGPDWVHVSFTTSRPNRKQILVASGAKTGAGATYTPFTGKEEWLKAD